MDIHDDGERKTVEINKREHFTSEELSAQLRGMTTVAKRQDAAKWIVYHKDNMATILEVWKREVLRANAEAVPQLLFVGGDVLQMTTVTAPSLAAGIGRLLTRLVATLLNKVPKESAQSLHKALYDLTKTLSTNTFLPREWVSSIEQALEAKIEESNYGWIHEDLSGVDNLWGSATACSTKAEAVKGKLAAMYEKLRNREIEGTPEELNAMSGMADTCLKSCDELSAKLAGIRSELTSKVIAYADGSMAALNAQYEEVSQARKRLRETDAAASTSKFTRTHPPLPPNPPPQNLTISAGDSDSDSDSDSEEVQFILKQKQL